MNPARRYTSLGASVRARGLVRSQPRTLPGVTASHLHPHLLFHLILGHPGWRYGDVASETCSALKQELQNAVVKMVDYSYKPIASHL